MQYWGKHLLIDAFAGNLSKISSEENIRNFVNDLVVKIDMVKYGDLWINNFATHDPAKAGYSFVQMIETSNITGHFVDADGNFYIDVFSCKDYDEQVVLELVDLYFSPESTDWLIVDRDASAFINE